MTKEKTIKRQVISEETSELMCQTLETVALSNGAYIKGYHVAARAVPPKSLTIMPATRKIR